ncbi:MAG: ATP-dependent sacrificial sulfur transferase LarE [Nitrososphaeria archaeon]|nr:ATP-dependent sacrificial sulfur transferase LarE [Nitrosopumilaceae archaeon]NIP09436.1 ATP-dependent sacrificial sulfur transferase LarE [Nitrosopumilaceae archaeon]NIP91759.1 ATP-dependent sacrificial sulfur transferase LarE [Nitrososphaeria archaeon]NIS95652.1 ATP-dependent sacrificial sulfur transferase LarE [Nitrosopumilaceae archaeon]
MNKLENLVNWFGDKRTLIALSGGVDSALVAYAAFQKLGNSAIAVTADYKTLSQEELISAKKIAKEIGISQILLDYNELENEEFVKNDSNRCFHCRQELGTRLVQMANEMEIDLIVDGTNLDDLGDYRPGLQALEQKGVRSPLVENKFNKNDVRKIAKLVGLSVYDKPSNSCLASRIPWGQQITSERLLRIELGETLVKQTTNLKQVRVRDLDGIAKLEIEKEKIPLLDQQIIKEIEEKLKTIGFSNLIIDPEGYRPGKINVIAD